MECSRFDRSVRGAVVAGLVIAFGLNSSVTRAQDAPLFTRPFNGVPLDRDELFIGVVPPELEDEARIAVKNCPEVAITISEEAD